MANIQSRSPSRSDNGVVNDRPNGTFWIDFLRSLTRTAQGDVRSNISGGGGEPKSGGGGGDRPAPASSPRNPGHGS